MYTKTLLLLSFLFLMLFSSANAQEQIERLFRGDRQNTAIDVAQTSDEGYLILSGGRPLDSTRFEFYNVTKFDNKTNLLWSMDYDFENKVFPDGQLILLEDDSFAISGILDTASLNKVLMKLDPSGNVMWTERFGRDDNNAYLAVGDAPIDTTYRGGFYIGGNSYNPLFDTDIFLAEVDSIGNQVWAKSYDTPATGFLTSKVRTTQDSGAILLGTSAELLGSKMFVVKTDTLGNIEWGREYGDNGLFHFGTAIAPTPDGGYLIGGRLIDPTQTSKEGILIKTDTFGVPQWSRNVLFGTSDTIHINDIIIANDGDAVISGSLLGVTSDNTFAFMAKIDLNDGDVVWKRRYKATTRQFTSSNGLVESINEGFAYLTSSDDEMDGTQIGPYLIKTDIDGTTICDSIIDSQLVFPFLNNANIPTDTLILTETIILDSADIMLTDTTPYFGYNLITLEDIGMFGPYCPDEMFSDTLDATTTGAISYEWSTGETTPTIVVTEFDEYKVTVTFGEYCYNLCAETTISEKPLPMIEAINIDPAGFCTNGTVNLNTITSNVDDFVWSTTEVTNSITVDTEGLYSVTVSNECGSTSDQINVVFDTSPPDVNITGDGTFCATGSEVLTATTSYPVQGYMWSNGSNIQTTVADAFSTPFTVTTMSNFCEDGTGSYTITPEEITVDIVPVGDFCATGELFLTAAPSSLANGFTWSTGATTDTITVTDLGTTYSVTVSDFCDNGDTSFDIDPIEITTDISSDGDFCKEGEVILDALGGASSIPTTYLWSTGETTETITVANNGSYSVTVSDFCDNGEDEFTVELETFTISIDSSGTFCADGDGILSSTTNPVNAGNNFSWSTGDTTQAITYTEEGPYSVIISNFCHIDTLSFDANCEKTFDIGNAFTPNGDNISEVFMPLFNFDPTTLVEYEFAIYSRWGEKVFETTDPLEGWDGTFKENPAASDVYIYKVSGINDLGVPLTHRDESKDNHGDVTLIR